TLFFSFSLYLSVDLLYLHSFPTRRSSDLGDIWTNLIQPFWALLYFPILALGTRLTVRDFMGYCLPILLAVGVIWILGLTFLPMRSEEHTSELQSRFDLVCRLLLEKKKCKN